MPLKVHCILISTPSLSEMWLSSQKTKNACFLGLTCLKLEWGGDGTLRSWMNWSFTHPQPTPHWKKTLPEGTASNHLCRQGLLTHSLPPLWKTSVENRKLFFSLQIAKSCVPFFLIWIMFVEENHKFTSAMTPAVVEAWVGIFVHVFKQISSTLSVLQEGK